jgi:trigger factor
MQVSVQKVNDVECQLAITVPADVLKKIYEDKINELSKKAKLKGFRPGKVPLDYIKKQFGSEVLQQALEETIKKTYYEAVAQEKLVPINPPKIEPKSIEIDKPLEYLATIEVLPVIDKVNFHMDNVEKLSVEVKEEDINRSLEYLSKQYAKWTEVDRPAQEKDRVVISYYSIHDGRSDIDDKMQDFPLELGSRVMIPGFEEGLIGAKAGDEVKLDLTYPIEFHNKNKAGQPATFVVTVKQAFEADIPELDEDFVKKLGIKSGKKEELIEQIKTSLEQESQRLTKEKIKEQVFKVLLESNSIMVPPSLVEQEAKSIHDSAYPAHQQHDHHKHSEEELASFNEIAKKRVSISLLISEYAKQIELKLDKERLQKRIKEIAAPYEKPEEVIQWLSSDKYRQNIEVQVMEDQVVDKLLENVPETIKTLSFAELKGIRV